jgi:hypothetical protein
MLPFIVAQGAEGFCARKIGRKLSFHQGTGCIPPKEAEERKLFATSMEEPHYHFSRPAGKTPLSLGHQMGYHHR